MPNQVRDDHTVIDSQSVVTAVPENRRREVSTSRRSHGTPLRAMVVDGEKVLAEMISITMRGEGWRVSSAWDGASAIQTARNEPLDVVVLDSMLPDMSALHLMARLREIRPNLLLFLPSSNDSVDGLLAGDDRLAKPVNLSELLVRMRALVRRTGVAVDDDSNTVLDDLTSTRSVVGYPFRRARSAEGAVVRAAPPLRGISPSCARRSTPTGRL